MCLAVPGKVLEIQEAGTLRAARVQFGGIVRQVSLDFVPEAVIRPPVHLNDFFYSAEIGIEPFAPLTSTRPAQHTRAASGRARRQLPRQG